MDIREAVSTFVSQGTELHHRLCSEEAEALSEVDIHMLRTQLHVLDLQAYTLSNLKEFKKAKQPTPNSKTPEA